MLGHTKDTRLIPNTANFFWAGSKLSWLRYMTLYSFRHYHPDWQMLLYRSTGESIVKSWQSHEMQDSDAYTGPDYTPRLASLNITLEDYAPPFPKLAPAHASDFFQWELLSTKGGFYFDMDILFVRPLPYVRLINQDAVFCLSNGFMTIGMFASSPHCRLFMDIQSSAENNFTPGKYQCTGAEAIYRLANVWPKWGSYKNPGVMALNYLCRKYQDLKIINMPSTAVYPFTYREVSKIFQQVVSVPINCYGIHWFGGSALSQQWNNILQPDTFGHYPNTITKALKSLNL